MTGALKACCSAHGIIAVLQTTAEMPNIKDLFLRKNFQKIPDHDQAISSSTACSFETIEFLRKFASNIFPAYSRAVIPKRTI